MNPYKTLIKTHCCARAGLLCAFGRQDSLPRLSSFRSGSPAIPYITSQYQMRAILCNEERRIHRMISCASTSRRPRLVSSATPSSGPATGSLGPTTLEQEGFMMM